MKQVNEFLVKRSALAGALLGFGAPLGYWIYSYFLMNPDRTSLLSWGVSLWQNEIHVLLYLTFSTILVFFLFGAFLGNQINKIGFKNQQMEHFLHIAAHDIKSPLTAVNEGTALLREGLLGKLTPEQLPIVDAIYRASASISELVTELLDIHKMEALRYKIHAERVSLISLIERSAEEMHLIITAKKGRLLIERSDAVQSELFLDNFRMRQVFRNLLSNAAKKLTAGGQIEITAKKLPAGGLALRFFNDGPVIPHDKLLNIFDKFSQADSSDQRLGTGLGLAICKNIMELHGGTIAAENIPNKGVAFNLEFPPQLIAQ